MGFFEFFGERHNPGPVGDLDVHRAEDIQQPGLHIRCVIAAAALCGWSLVLNRWASPPGSLIAAIVASLAYLVAAFFVHPKPDYSNVGFLGGIIDHPFRYSDDINRVLMFILVVLWPGRFIATTCMDALRAVRRR